MASESTAAAAAHAAHDAHDDGAVHVHISSLGFYLGIFAGLIFLTGVTVAVSYVDLGSANMIVALLVATLKASLVAAFFMHLTHDKVFHTIAFISSFGFLLIFFLLSYEDTSHRNRVDAVNGASVLQATGERAPGGMVSIAPVGGEHGHAEHGKDDHSMRPAGSDPHAATSAAAQHAPASPSALATATAVSAPAGSAPAAGSATVVAPVASDAKGVGSAVSPQVAPSHH